MDSVGSRLQRATGQASLLSLSSSTPGPQLSRVLLLVASELAWHHHDGGMIVPSTSFTALPWAPWT